MPSYSQLARSSLPSLGRERRVSPPLPDVPPADPEPVPTAPPPVVPTGPLLSGLECEARRKKAKWSEADLAGRAQTTAEHIEAFEAGQELGVFTQQRIVRAFERAGV